MSQLDIAARRIGAEGEPVVIVDGFHSDPAGLRAAAVARRFVPAERHYPGSRALLPDDYLAAIRPVVATVLRDVFGFGRSMAWLDASFSMVTIAPAALSVVQRMPHFDAVQPGRIALVHYLAEGDGTAFYRHRSTGFETIDEARAPIYFARLNAELRAHGAPGAAYIHDSDTLFERVALIDARPNRAILYRSALLHSGAIKPDTPLSDDPARGRLTVTAFLDAS